MQPIGCVQNGHWFEGMWLLEEQQRVSIISVELGSVPCNVIETLEMKREEQRNHKKKNNKSIKGPKCMQ
jgi:hypothetical protein